eukprot:349615-Chlamydomonas_euryale.AAC.12
MAAPSRAHIRRARYRQPHACPAQQRHPMPTSISLRPPALPPPRVHRVCVRQRTRLRHSVIPCRHPSSLSAPMIRQRLQRRHPAPTSIASVPAASSSACTVWRRDTQYNNLTGSATMSPSRSRVADATAA